MPFSTFLPFANFVQPFLPLLNSIQLFFTPPELCSTFFRPLNFVQLTQLLTLALLFRLHMCLSCDTAFLHLKKMLYDLFREISSSISITDIYSKCNLVSFIGISTIFPILCRGHTTCARQFYGKPRSHFGQRVWPRDVLTHKHKVLGISAHQNLTLALDFATLRIGPHSWCFSTVVLGVSAH